MTIKTETKTVEITLRKWVGGWDAGYEPDCFNDLAEDFSFRYPHDEEDNSVILIPDADLDAHIAWWQAECNDANEGRDGECLVALTEEEIDRGDEWVLGVDYAD